ncbi:MAG: hypothetical protein LLG20_21165 [Acidobacteriales bacterium]|nr:hypothetical protein [Terriglobales bacterium]
MLAVLQTLLYFGLLGYDYWHGARDQKLPNIREYLRQDLARPLFEPSGWCGAYTVFGFGQSAVMGIDLPAIMSASFLLAAVNGKAACVESLITPRGQMITAVFVLPLWFMLGTSIRRLAQRHWRKQVGRRLRPILAVGLVALPIGVFCLVCSVVAFFSESSLSVRLAGFAFWLIYIAALVAERLRVGPFRSLKEPVRA